jgi:branched-chain amino acid aminotransferase
VLDTSVTHLCYYDGQWTPGPVPLMTSATNAAWLANACFDGARAFEGVAPDLDLHCERIIRSGAGLNMKPPKTAREIFDLAWEGIRKFPAGTALYIRPMFWIEEGLIAINPASTRFALVLEKMPLPDPARGFSACMSPYRRPGPEQAPTHAKASCLYPLAMLAVTDAKARGFDNAAMCDPIGNLAEFTAQNVMLVKDGVVHTPVPNGTFLNGITRQRVIGLLRGDGITVHERTIRPAELLDADEIFSTGNHGKVIACTRFEQRTLDIGPIAGRARALYWQFAHAGTSGAPAAPEARGAAPAVSRA